MRIPKILNIAGIILFLQVTIFSQSAVNSINEKPLHLSSNGETTDVTVVSTCTTVPPVPDNLTFKSQFGEAPELKVKTRNIWAIWWYPQFDHDADADWLLDQLDEIRCQSINNLGMADPPNPGRGNYYNVYIHHGEDDGFPTWWGNGQGTDQYGNPYLTLPNGAHLDPGNVRHEGFHVFQYSANSPGFAYSGDSQWYVESSAQWYSVSQGTSDVGAFVEAGAIDGNPHIALWHSFSNEAPGDPTDWMFQVRQYGMHTYLYYLTEFAGMDRDIITSGFYAGTNKSPQQYHFDNAGGDNLRKYFADWAAHNTADFDYLLPEQVERARLEVQWVGDPDNINPYVAEYINGGTDGNWKRPPAALTARGWAYNVVRISNSSVSEYKFSLRGDETGSEGAPSHFEGRVVVINSTGAEYTDLNMTDAFDGSVSVSVDADDEEVYLVIAAVPEFFSGNQTYSYQYLIERQPQNPNPNNLKVFILAGQSNMVGHGTVTPTQNHLDKNGGQGTLEYMVNDASQSPLYDHLVDANGNWIERDDVWIVNLDRSGPLSVGYGTNQDHIGPEMQFGHVMGDYFDSQVLLIKVSWGGKSLQVDFRPPSSGGDLGPYYTLLIERVHEVLNNLSQFYPDYDGQGYELAGFGWHQGWNDRISDEANAEYQENCVNLINDLRAEFLVPDMPFVLATTGMSGWEETHHRALSLMEAQLAVPYDDRLQYGGNVLAVETRGYWRDADVSPADQGYHWNRSGETYFLIGNGMGEAMTELMSPSTTYELKVNNGSGDGTYTAGANIEITADDAPAGKMFDKWQVNSGSPVLANINAPSTILRMPSGNVTVTALYINDSGEYRDPDKPDNPVNGLSYSYYHGNWDMLPAFNVMTPIKTGTVSNFDLSERMQEDYYGFCFTGYVEVPSNGTYTFYTNSDDGSRIYIGTTLVTNNDGVHGMVEKSGQIALKAGKHSVRVDFFERAGGANLEVSYEGTGLSKQLIPNNALYYNDTTTSTDNDDTLPVTFKLTQNYPNPFNPSTTIGYSVPTAAGENIESMHINITVYDLLGKEVKTIVDDYRSAGQYEVLFDASGLSSGIYFYSLTGSDTSGRLNYNYKETRQMILLK